ncbi:hypothetical protein PUN28_018726 [Cardiocondyla obscurior]|uniref:Activin types I and II receptor domain-containing protein n=1 Tax=Cardiocondyla obscurior TaxID=286306 RepID=A0AAW2ECW6_9HYME
MGLHVDRRSLARYFLAGCIVSLSTNLAQVEGRKCACTSKACKEAGVDTCRTRFFCYTELIVTTGREIGESTTTRGCTEGATPLLCETKSWATRPRLGDATRPSSTSPRVPVPWPRLKCCNSHDYCNADGDDENASAWPRERKDRMRIAADREVSINDLTSGNRDATLTSQADRKSQDSTESATEQTIRNRIRALHVAALVLAVAALISVLASCYVVTRLLRSNRYVIGTVNYS